MTEESHPDVSVLFRKWKTCEDIVALFPYVPCKEDCNSSDILVESFDFDESYTVAEFKFMMENTIPACEVIYRKLKEKLESDGYLLRVIEEVDKKRMKSIYS